MPRIDRVVIVGGTHGNELTGVYLVQKFQQLPHLIQRSSFETVTLLANPKATALNRRYVDTDLNRCFKRSVLEQPRSEHPAAYELDRAREIYTLLTDTPPQNTLVLDLHTTTSQMGLTIIPSSSHPFNRQMAAYLTSVQPAVKVYRWPQTDEESPFLRSICPLGCAIEVGAVAQGVLDASLFQQTEALIAAILNYVEAYNNNVALPIGKTLTVYQCLQMVDYPRSDSGTLAAMVHPQLQFRDYKPLQPGDPMFLTFEGQTLTYESEQTVYPVFINEAAYYEKGIAMCLTQQQEIELIRSA